MAFAAYSDPRSLAGAAALADARDPTKRPGLWTRLVAAFAAARQRQADQEIARFIEMRGGSFTDEVERQIERRFL